MSDSKVGYIDGAIPGNQIRLRFDSAYNNRRPSRAEFFWAENAPVGPGVPLPETSVDWQDLSAYAEFLLADRLSAFLEIPTRFLNPVENANAAGLSDMNAGFKYAFIENNAWTATFQFRTYAPSGDAHRGLGNHHVSLEPAFLVYKPLSERLSLEGELRDWIPVGGTDFSGNILRYGLGLQYVLFRNDSLNITPVAEFVGWTVLGGKESVVQPRLMTVQSAAGDTIVNAKLGMRVGYGRHADIYAGYGQPLTGDQWYQNVFRLELRLLY